MDIRAKKMVKSIKNRNKIKYEVKELKIHYDDRGWLIEALKKNQIKQDIKQIYIATIKSGYI